MNTVNQILKKGEKRKKNLALLLAIIMVLTTIMPLNTLTANAASGVTVVKKYLPDNDPSGRSQVGKFMYEGELAFCLEHKKPNAKSGSVPTSVSPYDNPKVLKALYYGWGGPGQWSGFNGEESGIVLTSLLLDYYYTGGNHSGATSNGISFNSFKSFVESQSAPNDDILGFDKTEAKVHWDVEKQKQITEDITITAQGASDNDGTTIDFALPDGVTMVMANGTKKTGSVSVKQGDKFHLEADANAVNGTWSTGNVGHSWKYQALLLTMPRVGINSRQSLAKLRKIKDPVTQTSLSVEWMDFGKFDLTKNNETGNLIDGAVFNVSSTVASTGYASEGNDYTVKDGKISIDSIPVGKYTVTEKSAPDGYLLSNPKSFEINVEKDTVIENTIVDKEPRGVLEISKVDSETGKTPQGDATLKGAEYTLFAKEDIWNVNHDKKYYSKGDIVKKAVTDKDSNTSMSDIIMGSYYVQETKAPEGYLLDKTKYDVTFEYENQETPVIKIETTRKDDVKKMRLKIFKAGIKEVNGVIPGLEGAEFTVKLNTDVLKAEAAGYTYEEIWGGIDKDGNKVDTDTNRINEAQKLAPSRAVVTTDNKGTAKTDFLPYGKYDVKETKTPKDYYTALDFVVIIDTDASENDSDFQDVYVNNEQMESQIRLVKKDADSGKNVSLNSATFKVIAAEDVKDRATGKVIYKKGETIKQKIAGKWYDEFKTNSKGEVGTFKDDLGSVMLPLTLPVGKYKVEEIKLPTGFLVLEEPVTFNIENLRGSETDKDGQYIQNVIVKNSQPKGKVILKKTIERFDADIDFTDGLLPNGIEFGIYAAGNIIDMADGEKLYAKDDKVQEAVIGENGDLVFENLWMGDYYIKETKTLDGLVKDTNEYKVSFNQKDDVTKIIETAKDVVNKPTKTTINKVDLLSGNVMNGATLQVVDSQDGTVIDEWVSTVNPHVIAGLIEGKEYILHEEKVPAGFVKAEDIKFTAEANTEVTMKDDCIKVDFSKTDITTGDPVIGAQLSIIPLDKDGNPMPGETFDTWITEKEPHRVNYLPAGDYILREQLTGQAWDSGYVTAADVKFTVKETGEVQKVEMKDDYTKVEFSKTDITTGDPVIGAQLSIIPLDKDGNPMPGETFDTWITEKEPHMVNYLPVGDYILREQLTGQAWESGYVTAADVKFTVEDTGEIQKVEMKDDYTKVEISKTDITTGDPVIGAQLSIIPLDKDGNPMPGETFDTWITEKEPHMVEYLPVGDYILREQLTGQAWDDGYVTAADVKFTVKDTGEIQKVEMKDDYTKVEILKVDENNNPLVGAGLQLLDEEENIVDEWVSEEEAHYFERLPVGEYILREVKTPVGYATSKDIKFTIKDTDKVQKVEMKDEVIKVGFTKVDKDTSKPLADAHLQILDKDGKVVYDWVSTDKEKVFTKTPVGKYTLHEVSAPKGYKLTADQTFEIKDTAELQQFVISNKLIPVTPKTGDVNNPFLWILLMGLSLLGIVAMFIRRKHKIVKE